jgi:TonB-linked SusC/RagA family outer membrane protein
MARVRNLLPALVVGLLWAVPLRAQESTGTIRGRVIDATGQQPLSGVTVTVGSRVARTQAEGRYVVTAIPAGSYTLRARMIGYTSSEQPVTVAGGDTLVVDLTLTGQAVGLSAVVVVGYGEQSAGNITGAVTQISPAEFNTGRIITPSQLIQSKVAGVQVVENNEPGGGTTIRIRGATSVNASSDPLIVVDGVPLGTGSGSGISGGRDPLNFLNSDDIASITVLRDASAAAIYGANAANGVLLITTKSGKGRTAPQFEYTGTTSASSVTRLPSMLDAAQFRAAVTQYAPGNVAQLRTANTNWFDLVDRTGYGQEHNFAVSGAGASANYRLSVNYLDQGGIIDATNTKRVSVGLNYSQLLFNERLSLTTNLRGSRASDQFTPGGVISNAAQMGPTQPVYDTATVTDFFDWTGGVQSADNPLAILKFATDRSTTDRSIGNVQAGYRLPWIDGLTANLNLGFDVTNADRVQFSPSLLHSEIKSGHYGNYFRSNPSELNTNGEWYLNYAAPRNLGPGTLDLTGGYSYAKSHSEFPTLQAESLSTDLLGPNGVPSAKTTTARLNVQDAKLISFFGRVNYNVNDRYLAALSVRRDGSSRFGPGNQWGTFPSVALAWRISQESFLRNVAALSDLKLRASWAKTGNQAFGNYLYASTYTYGDAQAQYWMGNGFVTTIRPSAVDPNIKWEATRSVDIGVDYGFSSQRFTGAIDWYDKKTTDLIFSVPAAAGTVPGDFVTTNIGSMRNRGIEFSLSAKVLRGSGSRGLSWTADFTAARNSNELLTITPFGGATQQILTGGIGGGVGQTIQVLKAGAPINSFFVYEQKYDSVGKPIQGSYVDRPTVLDTIACPAGPTCVGLYRPDGVINQDDLRPFHDPAPKWILGHSSYLNFGKFDFGFTVRAYLGNYVYNNVASNLGTYSEVTRGSPYNLHSSVLATGFTTQQLFSDYYVEKASFVRMDNLTIGYSFSLRGESARVFGTLQNAFTITGYSGVDPTAGLNGIDNNLYPRSRTFTGGLSVRF